MVCPLVTLHLDKKCRYCGPINEPNVPVFILVDTRAQIQSLRHLMDQLVLCVGDVDDQRRVIVVRYLRFTFALDGRGRFSPLRFARRLFREGIESLSTSSFNCAAALDYLILFL